MLLPTIGLEVHAQMRTRTKAFCACPLDGGQGPNTATCPVCLGHPGSLPVLNMRLVEFAIRMGLATGCSIRTDCGFARKNYFYPDLPKGYQITQYQDPICYDGALEIPSDLVGMRRVGITRIHMEEDAGKSLHDLAADTLVDANRCGTPLLEIVSEPHLRSPAEAVAYLREIRRILTWLDICDGHMEDGSLRCDANVSLAPEDATSFGTKTEIKNMNSFRAVERALLFEIERQRSLLERGERVVSETRLWDAGREETQPMRGKEEAHDYRYFPEPDLPPLHIPEAWITEARAALPELPAACRARFEREYGLPAYDAEVLTEDRPVALFLDAVIAALDERDPERCKAASNWMMGEVLRTLRERKTADPFSLLDPRHLAELLSLVASGRISGAMARELFAEILAHPASPAALVEERGLAQVSDVSLLEPMIRELVLAHPDTVALYRSGRTQAAGFFVGRIMKATGGKANPALLHDLVRRAIEEAPSPDSA